MAKTKGFENFPVTIWFSLIFGIFIAVVITGNQFNPNIFPLPFKSLIPNITFSLFILFVASILVAMLEGSKK